MLIKMNWRPSYMKLEEREDKNVIVVRSLTGSHITTIRNDMPNLKNYLERMDALQYKRMRKYGAFI